MNLNSIVQQLQAEQQQSAVKSRAFAAAGNTVPAGGADSGSSSSGDPATITANDFLTLLVTELQNQDPTADTDPNEYVNQLVNVNSLQQLISINHEVGDMTPTAAGSASTVFGKYELAGANVSSSPAAGSPAPVSPTAGQAANARAGYATLHPSNVSTGLLGAPDSRS